MILEKLREFQEKKYDFIKSNLKEIESYLNSNLNSFLEKLLLINLIDDDLLLIKNYSNYDQEFAYLLYIYKEKYSSIHINILYFQEIYNHLLANEKSYLNKINVSVQKDLENFIIRKITNILVSSYQQ